MSAIKSSMRVEGLKELDAALAELVEATNGRTGKSALRKAVMEGAELFVRAAKDGAPVRFGHLRRGIAAHAAGNLVGADAWGRAMRDGKGEEAAAAAARAATRAARASGEMATINVVVAAGLHPQAIWQEFGTEAHSAQPFMRPAFDSQKEAVVDAISQAVSRQIAAAAQRAARRALRLKG